MRAVFVDTSYFVAIIRPRDPWKQAAIKASKSLERVRLLTTDEVLIELLNTLSKGDAFARVKAVQLVEAIFSKADIHVYPQSHTSMINGLALYKKRLDKTYSLTDCISMSLMRVKGIREILTNDHHFIQEGFKILMK